MKRITLGVGLSLLSFVTITMFQNCAQPGSLQMSEQEAYAAGAMDIVAMGSIEDSDIMAIVPTESAPVVESQPVVGTDTEGTERAPASEPATSSPTPVVSTTNDRDTEAEAPVTSTTPSQEPAPIVVGSDSEKEETPAPAPAPEKEEQVVTTDTMPTYPAPVEPTAPTVSEPVPPISQPVAEQAAPTPAPTPAPAPEEPVVAQAPAPTPAPEPVVSSTPSQPEDTDAQEPVLEPAVCSKERELMTDIKLHVASIQGVDLKGVQISIVDQQPFITTESRKIKIKASKDATLDKVNLVLDQSGNLVLFSNNTYAELKTPSAQQSGLKVHLDSAISMKAGKTYELLLQFELADQLVVAGKKCLFKPVIHTGNLSLASQ